MFDYETGMFQYEFKFDEVFKFEFKKKKKLAEGLTQSVMVEKHNMQDYSQAALSKTSDQDAI